MIVTRFDIFAGTFGSEAVWLEAVEGLGNAEFQMTLFAANTPGPYFVYCPETHNVAASMDSTQGDTKKSD